MEKYNGIKLGDKVKDRVSGFVGVVTAKIEDLTGAVQFQVTPHTGEASDMKAWEVDWQSLEVIQQKSIDYVQEQDPTLCPINTGDKVEDVITGLTGIVTKIVTFGNGCVRILAEPKHSKKTKTVSHLSGAWQVFRVVEASAFKVPKSKQAQKAKSEARGGPPMRSQLGR